MVDYSLNTSFRIKASKISFEKLIKLMDDIFEFVRGDNEQKDVYQSIGLEFKSEGQKRELKLSNAQLLNELFEENSLQSLVSVSVYASCRGNTIHLMTFKDTGVIHVSIETTDEAKGIMWEKAIRRRFADKTWNNIVSGSLFSWFVPQIIAWLTVTSVLISLQSISPAVRSFGKEHAWLVMVPYGIVMGALILLGYMYFGRNYPSLVVFRQHEASGREFKKDIKKFIGFTITAIILPITLQLVVK